MHYNDLVTLLFIGWPEMQADSRALLPGYGGLAVDPLGGSYRGLMQGTFPMIYCTSHENRECLKCVFSA